MTDYGYGKLWFAPRPTGMKWTQYAFKFGWIRTQMWRAGDGE